MTREQLDAIRARVDAAPSATKTSIEIDRDGTTRWVNLGPFLCFTHDDAAKVRDVVSFVHKAPTDLRALLAEIERLIVECDKKQLFEGVKAVGEMTAFDRGSQAMRMAVLAEFERWFMAKESPVYFVRNLRVLSVSEATR